MSRTAAAWAGRELEVSALPELPFVMLAGKSADVHYGTEAFALGGTDL